MADQINVLLVEDNRTFSRVVELALNSDSRIGEVKCFGTAESALRSVNSSKSLRPDVILLDVSLPGMSGIDAIPYFQSSLEDAQILILSQSDEEDHVVKALSQGAMGYLLKSSTSDEILDAVDKVAGGCAVLDVGVSKHVVDALRKQPKKKGGDHQLSEREQEILVLMAAGLSRKEIADQSGISITTVVTHINRIYSKFDVPNAPAAISKGYQYGILT